LFVGETIILSNHINKACNFPQTLICRHQRR